MTKDKTSNDFDVIIIGAGAAGLFCAGQTAGRGRKVLLLDHAKKIGEKIRISGGGRCNFTNIQTQPENFLSLNPKFCISALSGFTPQDFLTIVDKAGIGWHEKKLGQLFCNDSATDIINLLMESCEKSRVILKSETPIEKIHKTDEKFVVQCAGNFFRCRKLVIATGGKSIPKIGATGFGYTIARQFGLNIIEPRAGLVPLTFSGEIKEFAASLSGISVEASIKADRVAPYGQQKKSRKTAINQISFQEGFLFTHRGLSGPSILQISNYWREGNEITINLSPEKDLLAWLFKKKKERGSEKIESVLGSILPNRLVQALCKFHHWQGQLANFSDKALQNLVNQLQAWPVLPNGSEGYRTAEVTLGGVDTNALNSKTMEVKSVPGLFFIGEVVDVTGWLGGYNFQWAWSSGFAAAQVL